MQEDSCIGLITGGDVITFTTAQAEPALQAGAASVARVALAAVHTLAALRAVRAVTAQPAVCVHKAESRQV